MNNIKHLTLFACFILTFMSGCGNSSSNNRVDLDRVLQIMSETFNQIESESTYTSESVMMAEFERRFHADVNKATPKLHQHTIGVLLHEDASVIGYSDINNNGIHDNNEHKLFKVEIDAAGQRLLASEGERVREHRAGSGFFTGFLIASMLSRQRTAGVSRNAFSNKKPTPKQSSSQQKRKTSSAKSRSKSGSFSRGK